MLQKKENIDDSRNEPVPSKAKATSKHSTKIIINQDSTVQNKSELGRKKSVVCEVNDFRCKDKKILQTLLKGCNFLGFSLVSSSLRQRLKSMFYRNSD